MLWIPYVENIFLFSNKRLLKDNILVKQKINNKRLSSSLKKDNMSSNCLSSMLSTVIPLKWGHVSGIECLQYLEYNIYTQLILYSMLQKSLVASSHLNKLYTEIASSNFDTSEVSLNTSFKVSTSSTEHCRATTLPIHDH